MGKTADESILADSCGGGKHGLLPVVAVAATALLSCLARKAAG